MTHLQHHTHVQQLSHHTCSVCWQLGQLVSYVDHPIHIRACPIMVTATCHHMTKQQHACLMSLLLTSAHSPTSTPPELCGCRVQQLGDMLHQAEVLAEQFSGEGVFCSHYPTQCQLMAHCHT